MRSPGSRNILILRHTLDNLVRRLRPQRANKRAISSRATITILAAKSGELTITTTGNANVTVGGDTNITTTGAANIIAQGTTTVDGSTIKLGENAIEAVVKGNTFAKIYNNHVHLGNLGVPTGVPLAPMDPSLSDHTFTE